MHTVRLRRLEELLAKSPKRSNKQKFFYYRAYHRRDRMLNELMNNNYDRYLFVKDKLGLIWEPKDPLSLRRSTSYGKFKQEVHMYSLAQIEKKDADLKAKFDDEKIEFYEEKNNFFNDLSKKFIELNIQVPDNLKISQA